MIHIQAITPKQYKRYIILKQNMAALIICFASLMLST